MTECEDGDRAKLKCSVVTDEACHHTVRWLFNGQNVDEIKDQTMTSEPECSATFLESRRLSSSEDDLLTCEVMETRTGNVQQFPFRPQSSAGETGEIRMRRCKKNFGLCDFLFSSNKSEIKDEIIQTAHKNQLDLG